MTAVHPGLWHPTLVAKMAASLDRLTRGRTAINLVTGWNVEEHRMFGGDALFSRHGGPSGFLARYSRQLPSPDVELTPAQFRRLLSPIDTAARSASSRPRHLNSGRTRA